MYIFSYAYAINAWFAPFNKSIAVTVPGNYLAATISNEVIAMTRKTKCAQSFALLLLKCVEKSHQNVNYFLHIHFYFEYRSKMAFKRVVFSYGVDCMA